MSKAKPKILLLGGYGNFGKRLAANLAKIPEIQLIIAGRDLEKANKVVSNLKEEYSTADIQALALDRTSLEFEVKLSEAKIDILIHLAGPFQDQDYRVVKACIDHAIHYLDIADARDYVKNISKFDRDALQKNLVVISGASSVPGVSSAVIDKLALNFTTLRLVEFGISPGNKVERGVGTLQSVFQYVGKPFKRLENGEWQQVYGWQDTHREYFGDNLGLRWQASCDIPDLDLLPQRYTNLKTVKFYAGLEVGFLHNMLWSLSWLVRIGLIKDLSKFSKIIEKTSHIFDKYGTNVGGMNIRLYGTDEEFHPLDINWHMVAESGHGLNIPIIPAIILTKKILQDQVQLGARPCMGLFTLEEFDQEAKAWNIYHTLNEDHF